MSVVLETSQRNRFTVVTTSPRTIALFILLHYSFDIRNLAASIDSVLQVRASSDRIETPGSDKWPVSLITRLSPLPTQWRYQLLAAEVCESSCQQLSTEHFLPWPTALRQTAATAAPALYSVLASSPRLARSVRHVLHQLFHRLENSCF